MDIYFLKNNFNINLLKRFKNKNNSIFLKNLFGTTQSQTVVRRNAQESNPFTSRIPHETLINFIESLRGDILSP